MFVFTDDTKCKHAAKTICDFNKIQEDLSNWSVSSNLLFKCPKSAVLDFWSNKHATANISSTTELLIQENQLKILRLW